MGRHPLQQARYSLTTDGRGTAPAICHPFSSLPPRIWYREGEHGEWIGAWLVGGDSVVAWLEHFCRDRGLGPADLGRLDELSKPNWLRLAIPTSATWPPLPH